VPLVQRGLASQRLEDAVHLVLQVVEHLWSAAACRRFRVAKTKARRK
jgi:hypothetical protein